MTWIKASERMPQDGQLVVKRWARFGTVWAGRHSAHSKHESFDEWIPLP